MLTSSVTLSILIDGGAMTSWPITFVFLILMINPKLYRHRRICPLVSEGFRLCE